jgi:selenocysteine lyase/cysteine desulfurase
MVPMSWGCTPSMANDRIPALASGPNSVTELIRPSAARASFGIYNDMDDVARLAAGIERVTRIFGTVGKNG